MAINALRRFHARLVVSAHRDQSDPPWSHRLRPNDACIVVTGFDDCTNKSRYANAVAAHKRRYRAAVRPGNLEAKRLRIFVAEIEDVADLDASPGAPFARLDLAPRSLVVRFVGGCIGRAYLLEQPMQASLVAIVHIRLLPVDLLERGIVEDLALAGRRKHDE